MKANKATLEKPIGLYYKLGYNMWKVQGSGGEWYYISCHLNPEHNLNEERTLLMMCSCRSFTIGIPSDCKNPFITPCKHIEGFDEKEVDIEEMESHSES